jgi:hypothetical protein
VTQPPAGRHGWPHWPCLPAYHRRVCLGPLNGTGSSFSNALSRIFRLAQVLCSSLVAFCPLSRNIDVSYRKMKKQTLFSPYICPRASEECVKSWDTYGYILREFYRKGRFEIKRYAVFRKQIRSSRLQSNVALFLEGIGLPCTK